MNNPYNKSDEAKYLTWDHGFNAVTESENPYSKDDGELFQIWKKGYRANKGRSKIKDKASNIDSDGFEINEASDTYLGLSDGKLGSVTAVNTYSNLESIDTSLLELELKKRKLKELDALFKEESKLIEQLQLIKTKIERLKLLMGD